MAPNEKVRRFKVAELATEPLTSEDAVRRFVQVLMDELLKEIQKGNAVTFE